MPRLFRPLIAALVIVTVLSPVAERQAPQAPVLASYTAPAPATATGREWDGLRAAIAAQQAWYVAQAAIQAQQAPAEAATPVQRSTGRVGRSYGSGSHRGYATARECVSDTENGGDYGQGTNRTHRGRYQFGRPAWISFGGVPEHWDDWSLATPAEQDQVFDNAWDQGPAVQYQQWLRWDGC